MKIFDDLLLEEPREQSGEIIPIVEEDGTVNIDCNSGDVLPVLPLRNISIFPMVVVPVPVGRQKSLRIIREVYQREGELLVVSQKDSNVEEPVFSDLYSIGTVARILRILELPDGSTTAIIQGKKRARLQKPVKDKPYMTAEVLLLDDILPQENDREFSALLAAIKDLAMKVVKISGSMPDDAGFAIRNMEQPQSIINFICTNFGLKLQDKQRLLEIDNLSERGYALLDLLTKEFQLLEIKASIQAKARMDMDQQQREYYLQQQMKTIQEELGNDNADKELEEIKAKAQQKKWSKQVAEAFNKELRKLERMPMHAPDYPVQLNYVETFVNLPWNEYTKDNFDMKKARRMIDKDHFGMDDVKDRILEYLSVLKLKGDMKAPILCLYGPPGVGKTSLCRSIANTLNRKYVRMSLGGMHDEAEIRGHRRTYIGAMPGRIIGNIKKAGSSNPVFVLDEIDKVNANFNGDPASALLEVLDSEQNANFHDNFLDVDYDLSKVLFIATCNDVSTIAKPLLDRMELIEVNGYLLDEKVEIAMRHLIPKELEANGLTSKDLKFSRPAVKMLIENYTRESGVRELERVIAKVMRKIALKKANDEEYEKNVKPEDLQTYLGAARFEHDKYDIAGTYGVVTGLAWTSVGGEILYIETSLSKGKGNLTLTGNLGDVMKESATLALQFVKAHATELGIDEKMFDEYNVHIHVPEGAIPKDGPSAGIALLTALVSSFAHKKVKPRLAMTGEITLRGKVLPIGGLKEKLLAAKRAGITDVILCVDNKKDVDEIKAEYLKGLNFHFVRTMFEVLDVALEKK